MKPIAKDKYEIVSEMAKRRGYFWPSYEIYGGVSGFLTFGPLGSSLKKRLEEKFRRFYLQPLAILEIETSVIMPGNVLEASGHVENFKEPTVECVKCNRKFRADHLLQEFGEMTGKSSSVQVNKGILNAEYIEQGSFVVSRIGRDA